MTKKKLRVYQEDAKTRHTAHWDWDYLSWEEIEHRLNEAGIGEDTQPPQSAKSRKKRRSAHVIWIGLGLLIVAVLMWVAIPAALRWPMPATVAPKDPSFRVSLSWTSASGPSRLTWAEWRKPRLN